MDSDMKILQREEDDHAVDHADSNVAEGAVGVWPGHTRRFCPTRSPRQRQIHFTPHATVGEATVALIQMKMATVPAETMVQMMLEQTVRG